MITEALIAAAICLEEAGIPYMVIGGQAVLQYGEARLTQDIDLTVALTPDEVDTILPALKKCGFSPVPSKVQEFVMETWVLPVELMGKGVRLDVVFSVLPFERAAIDKARKIEIGGIPVRFINPEDLIVQKIIAGRPRDLEDVEGIVNIQRDALNGKTIRSNLEAIGRETGNSAFVEIWDMIVVKSRDI